MKHRSISSFVLVVIAICISLPGARSLRAQSPAPNLLRNPAFDPPWEKQRDLCGSGAILEEVQVPEGWQGYYACKQKGDADNINRTPEFRMVSSMDYADRVRSAPTALRYFNFWALNTSAGVYQVVDNVTPGARLRFSLWVQLWTSNSDGLPPSSQKEPGDLEARICIDQDGGAPDLNSLNTVCTPWARPWDRYELMSVEGSALGNQVTVALNTRAKYPVKHNDVQADDAELVVIGQSTGQSISQSSAPVAATPRVTTNQSDVHLRAAPSLAANTYTLVPQGTVYEVRGRSVDKDWWRVAYAGGNDGSAWLHSSVVDANAAALALDSASAPPAAATPLPALTPTPTPAPVVAPAFPAVRDGVAKVTSINSLLNVRAAPSFEARSYAQAPRGTDFEVRGRSDDRVWWQVAYPSGEGGVAWVLSYLVKPNAQALGMTANDKPMLMANRALVNVRAAPSSAARVYAQVKMGAAFEVVGRTADRRWWKVNYSAGKDGVAWMLASVVKVNTQTKNVPVAR